MTDPGDVPGDLRYVAALLPPRREEAGTGFLGTQHSDVIPVKESDNDKVGWRKLGMFVRGGLFVPTVLFLALSLAVAPAAERIASGQRVSLTITRVIPGHHDVTIEWLRPETTVDVSDMRYRVAAKFRTASWDDAKTTIVRGDRTSAALTGLLNNADYAVRVVAETLGTSKLMGTSEERLVTPGAIPGVVIDYLHKDDRAYGEKGQYIGSPSIARLDDGRLVASHDVFGRGGTKDYSRIFRSDDQGRSWYHVADVHEAFWGKLFVHNGELCLLACSRQYGDIVLHRSADGGEMWARPVVLASGRYHKAPVPVVRHRGRLWTCVELQTGGWPAGFQAVVLSAPADADVSKPENWTVSKPLPCDPAWLPKGWDLPRGKHGFLEGNAVVNPQGNLLNILRYHVSPHFRKAVVLTIAPDGKSLSFNRLIDFYGGMTKFTIRRNPETGMYWSLVNRVTRPEKPGMRNVLTLVSSPNLDDWTAVRDILRDDRETAPEYVGFQYIDWLFDGDDIILVSRTAYNGAHNFHDANHLTFHRVKNFADAPRWVGP